MGAIQKQLKQLRKKANELEQMILAGGEKKSTYKAEYYEVASVKYCNNADDCLNF